MGQSLGRQAAWEKLANELYVDLFRAARIEAMERGEMLHKQQLASHQVLSVTLKMYQEKHHKTPHLHVDLKTRNHAASFSILPAAVIEGGSTLSKDQRKAVLGFIQSNGPALLAIWNSLKAEGDPKPLIAELPAM